MKSIAAIENPALGPNLQPTGTAVDGPQYFNGLLSTLVTLFFIAGGIIFLFMLLTGAIQWLTSGGDKAKTEGARNRLAAAIVGIVLLFSVYAIVSLVESIFQVNILTINISNLILN